MRAPVAGIWLIAAETLLGAAAGAAGAAAGGGDAGAAVRALGGARRDELNQRGCGKQTSKPAIHHNPPDLLLLHNRSHRALATPQDRDLAVVHAPLRAMGAAGRMEQRTDVAIHGIGFRAGGIGRFGC